jgi:hypothetical protein
MNDAYETPFDRYDTPFDGDDEARWLDAALDRLEASLDRLNGRLDRLIRMMRRLFILLTIQLGLSVWILICLRSRGGAMRRRCHKTPVTGVTKAASGTCEQVLARRRRWRRGARRRPTTRVTCAPAQGPGADPSHAWWPGRGGGPDRRGAHAGRPAGGRDRDGGRHLVSVEVTVKALLLCLTLSLLLSVCGVGCGTGRPPVKTLEQCWRIAWR